MARGRGTFGLTSRGRRGSFNNFRGGFRGRGSSRGRGGRGGAARSGDTDKDVERGDDGTQGEERFERAKLEDEVDEKLGFPRFSEGPKREAWLVNMHPTLVKDEDWPGGRSAVDFYFIQDDGGMFKCTIHHEPYFYIGCKNGTETIVEEWLLKKYEGKICRIIRERKEDLTLPNHLLGYKRLYLQLHFRNVWDLLTVRKDLLPVALENSAKINAVDAYAEVISASTSAQTGVQLDSMDPWSAEAETTKADKRNKTVDPMELIMDIREYDIPYYLRVAIDNDIRVGLWYNVTASQGVITLSRIPERVKRADPVVMAYDIETSKAPLKFPDQEVDQIMMISYMIDGQGFLITNRDIVGEDIDDFEYTPRPEYEGPFTIFNEPDEAAVIRRWFEHIRDSKPTVMATYNGDSFDFPFVEARAKIHGIDMFMEIGFAKDSEDEFKSRSCIHMDCFRWVKRDSYLPQGSQGLKAVTTAKLGYNPIELDPELMTPYAVDHPQILAEYSVSDAVATYYLYMKYVHPFVFSLCNIIPLNPDDVLRKGSGTLCETLLMVEAYRGNIIMPNRHEEPHGNMFEGHLLASETYVGGHVEALEAGVFRSDIPTHFKITPDAVQSLIDDLDAALEFCIVEESKMSLDNITNYAEVKYQILAALEELRDNPMRTDKPLIYHLDVAAMYPNIMLSNRLQPDSVVDEAMCAVCDYNRPGKTCDRRMTWAWRGEYFPAQRDEFNMVKHALNQEWFDSRRPNGPKRRFVELTQTEQTALLHKRLGDYSRKVYKKTKDTKVVEREAIICQRENPFYIDTVRSFRDRRYEYKGLLKTWKKNSDIANAGGSLPEIEEAKKMIVLYDSLQLAHKCILNSFYGYVMRKGARWHSMEMAGITCLTGAKIIQMARQLVEQIGRPLELDTDGIWCMLPGTFPENFTFKVAKGKPLAFSYPCTMLNHLVHAQFTNHQYHDLVDSSSGKYAVHSENSIFFELDGPYRAMILPSSKEEDKLLKKRYAVFNDDGSLAELKGFEVKRRGELQLIKIFQSQIFEKFLLGTTTEECYTAVAKVADQWLDVLFSKGASLGDDELIELIAENRSMSKTLSEYGAQKSTSISTAKRLADFLGDQMVKDKGLSCKFIISARPIGAPVTERAIPVAIFSAEESVKRAYLRKWIKDNSIINFDLRSILDWNYYIERLGSVIQKLITIPAAMQKVSNPVPRIRHPDWLHKRVSALEDKFQQHKVTDFFKRADPRAAPEPEFVADMEDFGQEGNVTPHARVASVSRKSDKVPGRKPEAVPRITDPSVNYSAWLKAMRPVWKSQREDRLGGTGSKYVPAMFRGVKAPQSRTWEVIQIRATRTPGKFVLWLALGLELVPVPLRVPRQFYLNLKAPPDQDTFGTDYTAESIIRTLPRNHPCLNLFRLTVPEEVYMEAESHFANLINNPGVDGVYEMQIPHIARALLKLGTSCTAEDGHTIILNQARESGIDLHQLSRSPPSLSRRKYLDGGKAYKYILLFHCGLGRRQVFALFYPNGTLKLHLVDPATARQPLAKLQETYSDLLRKNPEKEAGTSFLQYPATIRSDATYHGSETTALKAISRELGLMENQSYILVLSSAKHLNYFEDAVPKLAKFPVLVWEGSRRIHSLEGLMWQTNVVEKMFLRYVLMDRWLRGCIEDSTYFDIPIGNIGGDRPLLYADTVFARRLLKQDHVLWWSPGTRPDLGGREEDGNVSLAGDELASPELCKSGCYSNVCLSIGIKQLAINAVLQSALVNEMEGSGGATAFDGASHNLDEYARGDAQSSVTLGDAVESAQAFGVLKAMVKTWELDYRTMDGQPARITVDHFWRWLSSTASQMFDPSLQRFIHGLMTKIFYQMLAELKRLGSNIVSADFGHIILLTSKPPGTAYAYATYLLTAINSNDLFKHILLQTDQFYDFLLFMDKANQGGIVCIDPLSTDPPAKITINMAWNIQAFLPLAIHRRFREVVQRFIVDLHKIHNKNSDPSRTPLRVVQNLSQDSAQAQDAEKLKEDEALRTYFSQRLTRRLLETVSVVLEEHKMAMMEEQFPSEYQFPLLPGSHLNMTNPPLEFVKSICAVFDLANTYANEVSVLKRNLLDLVGVKEFSDEAKFRNPCEPFKLPMVICSACNDVRDFDFCRDLDLLPRDATPNSPPRWQCARCFQEYDRQAIEASLIEVTRRLGASFQLQDLRCARCKAIKSDNLSQNCNCSGDYQLTVAKNEARRKLRTIVNVAVFYKLDLLKEYAEFMLDRW